ncbi:MAG: hypothetical protein AVO35_01325 [Candidatus Aegiribacteria sp. MLS_C]|nr:MAG: hypothetical protein AVO35_01325 [Candidatus Aegiribacteria sp. MLS_C]
MRRSLFAVLLLAALAPARSIVETFDSPAGDISGLGWESGTLWALDAVNKMVYAMDPSSGQVTGSFTAAIATGYYGTGLAVENGYVYVGAWNNATNGYVYKYDTSGGYLGAVGMCGG